MSAAPTGNDGDLLRAFRTTDDQQAFAELLRRHGGAVRSAAQSVVSEASAAQDVAQAAFLTLARKAAGLEANASVAAWLHHVTICLARNQRRRELRRAAREKEAVMLAVQANPTPGLSAAARAALHEEIAKLAEQERAPLVLHHLEGLSYTAAAAALGWPPNSFGPRLTRAREKLRRRLAARGVALGADGLGALEESATSVALPAAFVAATCQAASLIAAGKTLTGSGLVSAKVAYLTKSALKTLFWDKVKTAAAVVALTAGVAVGGGLAAHQALAHRATPPSVTTTAPADTGGCVWAWGRNGFGQLGDGTADDSLAPVQVRTKDGNVLSAVTAISAGDLDTVAVRADGSIWVWGGHRAGAGAPVRIADGADPAAVMAVAAGTDHLVALTRNGTVWTSGAGDLHLTRVPGLEGIVGISAAQGITAALGSDGRVWTWGQNAQGQLGDGTTAIRPSPVEVKMADGTPLAGTIAVSAGRDYMLALKSDGSIWGWGRNDQGQLGARNVNRDERCRLAPVQIGRQDGTCISDVTAIAAGYAHGVALRRDGRVWVWGSWNGRWREPEQIKTDDGAPLSGITAVSAGRNYTIALGEAGTVWVFGSGSVSRMLPRRPGEGSDAPTEIRFEEGLYAIGIAAGMEHAVVLTRGKNVGL